jgi:hypothetical protein
MLVINFYQLPLRAIKGDTRCIKINQQEYELGIEESKKTCNDHLLLYKGDKPDTARKLHTKLSSIWKEYWGLKANPLGKGFYEFHFSSADDMKNIWSSKTLNLKPCTLRLIYAPHTSTLTHKKLANSFVWICLMNIPQRTLTSIYSF